MDVQICSHKGQNGYKLISAAEHAKDLKNSDSGFNYIKRVEELGVLFLFVFY